MDERVEYMEDHLSHLTIEATLAFFLQLLNLLVKCDGLACVSAKLSSKTLIDPRQMELASSF